MAFAAMASLLPLSAPLANSQAEADLAVPPSPSLLQQLQQQLGASAPRGAAAPSSHSTIRLLVLHEPSLGSDPGQMSDLIATTNAIYQQSGVDLTFDVAAYVPFAIAPGSNSNALDAITNSTEVAAIRETFGADMVTLLRPYDRMTHGGCGFAWIIGTASFDPFSFPGYVYDYAFSVSSVGNDGSSFCFDSTIAHELGHNFGAVHERGNTSITPRRPYAYGWGFDGSFGTVMSYIRPGVDYFSTPDLATCNGFVCGDAAQADVVRAINEVRDAFAVLMPDVTPPSAPTIDSASPLVDEITLYFTAGNDGGAGIDQYTASCNDVTQTGSASPITVTGLFPATPHGCTVDATNSIGTGPPSETYFVETLPVPAPVITAIEADDSQLTVYLEAPAILGSYDILGYTVTCGDRSASDADTRITIQGLSNGVSYQCTATTSTNVGPSASSGAGSGVPDVLVPGLNLPLLKAIIDGR